jgi:hypothetical protein
MRRSKAAIVREYGPFPEADRVHGVTYDGQNVWFASAEKLNAFDPASGKAVRSLDVAAHAGAAFDGEHICQLVDDRMIERDRRVPSLHFRHTRLAGLQRFSQLRLR